MTRLPALLPAACLLAMCGCWGTKFVDMPGRVETMEADQVALRAEVDSLRAAALMQEGLLRGLQAQSGSRTGELVEQLSALTDEMEQLLRRVSSSQGSRPSPAVADSTASASRQTVYDEAYLQYQQRDYQNASAGFLELFSADPAGPLADDALYFAALCSEGLALPHKAVEQLVALRIMYPESDRAPAALFRAAGIYGAHSASADRDRLLQDLVTSYPDSEEAHLAVVSGGE